MFLFLFPNLPFSSWVTRQVLHFTKHTENKPYFVVTAVFSSQTLRRDPAGTAHWHVCEMCILLSSHSSTHCWPISLPLWRVIQLPAVIQIITFTHALSPSPFPPLVSLSLAVFSPPVVIENGQLNALREALHEKQEQMQCIAL